MLTTHLYRCGVLATLVAAAGACGSSARQAPPAAYVEPARSADPVIVPPLPDDGDAITSWVDGEPVTDWRAEIGKRERALAG
jgi:hypothetical protein